jgi:predicted ATPase
VVPEVKQLRALPASISKVDMVDVSIDGQHTQVERERTVSGARFEADIAGVGWTRAEQLSEATLLVLALVTQLHYHRPGLLLLDDLDRSLHPTAQVALVKVLRTLLEQHPELQILASTHSPYLVDELEGSEVLVAGETAPGTTQVRPLTDHPDWDAHRETLRSGELWSAVAEGWVGESK